MQQSRTHRVSARSSTTMCRRRLRSTTSPCSRAARAPPARSSLSRCRGWSGQTVSVGYATADVSATREPITRPRAEPGSLTQGQVSRTITVQVTVTPSTRTTRRSWSTSPTRSTPPSRMARASARSPTTTGSRRFPSTTSRSRRAAGSGVNANFNWPWSAPSCGHRERPVRDRERHGKRPADYTALPLTTITFSPGQVTRTVTVTVAGELLDEIDESFTLNLSNVVNATSDLRPARPDDRGHDQPSAPRSTTWPSRRATTACGRELCGHPEHAERAGTSRSTTQSGERFPSDRACRLRSREWHSSLPPRDRSRSRSPCWSQQLAVPSAEVNDFASASRTRRSAAITDWWPSALLTGRRSPRASSIGGSRLSPKASS